MAGSTPPPAAAAYEEWILETIDSLRSRKARPDLERICRMVRRRHGPEPERTRQELERMVQRRAVLRVSYKGSISYRNAARLQPPRRSRGGGGGKVGNPAAAGSEQEGVQSGHEGGSPRRAVQQGESPRRGAQEEGSPRPGAPEGGSTRQGLVEGGGLKDGKLAGYSPLNGNCGGQQTGSKKEGPLGDYPKDGNLGFGSASDAMFGLQGFGSLKDNMPGEESPKGVHSGRQDLGCSKEMKFGVLEEVDTKKVKLVGSGDWSLSDRKLWLQGGQSPKDCQQEAIPGVHGGWSPKDMKFGTLGVWDHRDGKSGPQGCCKIKDGKFGVLAGRSPKDLMPGMHRPLSPMDCKLGMQVSGTFKEVIPGVQADGSPQNGKLGVQEWGNSKNGKCGVPNDLKAKDWKHGLQVGGTPKDGKLAVPEKGSSREILSVSQGGRNLKDGKLGVQGVGRSKEGKHGALGEGIFGVQDKHGTLMDSLCLTRETGGELEEEKRVTAEGILGIQGNLGPGLQGETWVTGDITPNNGCPRLHGSRIPREENMEERSRRTVGSKVVELRGKTNPENMEKGILDLDGVVGSINMEKGSFTANEIKSCKDVAHALKSREQEPQNEERAAEQSLKSLVKEGHKESVLSPRGRSGIGANRNDQSQCQEELQTPKAKGLLEQESSGLLDSSSLGSTGVLHQSLRLARNGTPVQEEDEPPRKRPHTESPEPGGERSRRSLGLSPNSALPAAPNTRSGSRRPPSSAPARVERLTRARGRWQQEEEQSRIRPQRSRSRPERSLVRTLDVSTESSIPSSRATRSKKMEEDTAKGEGGENVSLVAEGSELQESEDDKTRTCVDKTKDTSPKTPAAEPDLAQGELLADTVACEDEEKKECSSKDNPVLSKNAELEFLVAKPFNSLLPDCHPDTIVQCLSGIPLKCMCNDLSSHDKNTGMCNSTCPQFKKEEECNAKTLPSVKNNSGCNAIIDSLDNGSSLSEPICLRPKPEEGCNTTLSPLVECAVKAVPVKAVKLEDHSGEPRDCEASLGIEGVEPHLPVRVSPVTPMILNMDRNSYRKISVTKKPSDPMCWTVMDVVQYFTEAGFAEQASAFKEQEIDGKSLLLMQRTDVLTGLSIRLGPALKMYEHHIKILQQCHFAEENDFLG